MVLGLVAGSGFRVDLLGVSGEYDNVLFKVFPLFPTVTVRTPPSADVSNFFCSRRTTEMHRPANKSSSMHTKGPCRRAAVEGVGHGAAIENKAGQMEVPGNLGTILGVPIIRIQIFWGPPI